MTYIIIFLGLLLAIIPSFFIVYDQENKRIKLSGIVLLLLSGLFLILNISDEKQNSNKEETNKLKIDSLNYKLNLVNQSFDSISLNNEILSDSISNLRIALLEKDNEILRTVNQFESKTKKYQSENLQLQKENFNNLKSYEKGKVMLEEPSFRTYNFTVDKRRKDGRFPYEITAINQGGRYAMDFDASMNFYIIFNGEIVKHHRLPWGKRRNKIIKSGEKTKYRSYIPDYWDIEGRMYIIIDYMYKDKLQPDRVITSESFYWLKKDSITYRPIVHTDGKLNYLKELIQNRNN